MTKHERKAIKSEITTIKRNMATQAKNAARELSKHRKSILTATKSAEKIHAVLNTAQKRADARIATLTARLGSK